MSSAFDLPVETELDPTLCRRIAETLSPSDRKLEEDLQAQAWFPYRLAGHIDRTVLFVCAFDRIYLSLIDKNADLPTRTKDALKRRGHWLKYDEILAPWARPTRDGGLRMNPRWKHWVEARRCADRRAMIYEDYVAGALLSAIKRGWGRWPEPNQLHSAKLLGVDPNDRYVEATIPAYEAGLYAGRAKLTDDPFFRADAYVGHPVQDAYYRYAARELMRVYQGEQRARNAWRGYQRDGKIIASLSFDEALQ